MLDENGMSRFDAQPINTVQTSTNPSLRDDHIMSYDEWVDSLSDKELAAIVGDYDVYNSPKGVDPRDFWKSRNPFDVIWSQITGQGKRMSDNYQHYKARAERETDLLNQYNQFAKLGISPYALLDSTSVSASGSSNLRQKEKNDDSSRLLGIMILALARIAAAAI